MKPVMNIDEVELSHKEKHGDFESSYGIIGQKIGAKKLGYSLSVVPPGKKVCPFHNHRVGEEMFLILEGTGTLRFGDGEYPLRPLDVIACPPGGREVAHQIVNTGTTDLKYFCLGTSDFTDVCEYPDSDKVLVVVGEPGQPRDLRHVFEPKSTVDYFKGES